MKKKENVILPSDTTYRKIRKLFDFCLNLIFPKRCPCCDEAIGFEKINVHKKCYDNLPLIKDPTCQKCGKQLFDDEKYCYSCQKNSHYFDQGRALYNRNKVTRRMIARMKYNNERYIGTLLGSELAKKYAEIIKVWKIEAIVPVPIHNNRRKIRGFNQSLDIAKGFQKSLYSNQNLKIPILPTLVIRKDDTKRQKDLSVDDKKNNLLGVFYVKKIFKRMPQSILIIDDIYTSGATIDEISFSLKRAGVRQVYFLAITTGSMI